MSGHGVGTAAAPRVAATEASGGEAGSGERPVPSDGFDGVRGTGRAEATDGPAKEHLPCRGKHQTIEVQSGEEAQAEQVRGLHAGVVGMSPARPRARRRSFSTHR